MSVEIEKKYRLTQAQYDDVLESLNEIGAEFIGEDFEENILFGNEFLKQKQALLRVRRIGERTILTYKEATDEKLSVKKRIEHETEVANFEAIEKIIEGLGFGNGMVYEKRRKSFNFKQVEIVLDELPFGLFMEIEGSMTGIAEAEMYLGADEFEVEYKSYPYLTYELGVRKGNKIEARFS
jgi:adenylate cyclase, class 2